MLLAGFSLCAQDRPARMCSPAQPCPSAFPLNSPKYLEVVPSSAWTTTSPGRRTCRVGTWAARIPKAPVCVGTSTCRMLAPLKKTWRRHMGNGSLKATPMQCHLGLSFPAVKLTKAGLSADGGHRSKRTGAEAWVLILRQGLSTIIYEKRTNPATQALGQADAVRAQEHACPRQARRRRFFPRAAYSEGHYQLER